MIEKIALGTVQFGLDYGINNPYGKIKEDEVFRILDFAKEHRIDTLDTAYLYGDSEKVLGKYTHINTFKIVSKFPDFGNIEFYLNGSLSNLKTNNLYAYMLHNFPKAKNNIEKDWAKVQRLKYDGKITKIGFSLYYKEELLYLIDKNIEFDILQIPYNIFDRRFEDLFCYLKEHNIEIHTRSIFLQGLLFMDHEKLNPFFEKIKPKIKYIRDFCKQNNVKLNGLLLYFALKNDYIDKVVIGVDSLNNLIDNVNIDFKNIDVVYKELNLEFLKEDDEEILVPSNWRLK